MAVSDENLILARELDILQPKQFWNELPSLLKSHEISRIVLGLPIGVSGNETEKTKQVREFGAKLEIKALVPVDYFDERFSSVMAKNAPGGKINVDSLAAQIILQNYLDTQKNVG